MKTMTFRADSTTTEYLDVFHGDVVFYGRVYTPQNNPLVHFPSQIIEKVVVKDMVVEPLVGDK